MLINGREPTEALGVNNYPTVSSFSINECEGLEGSCPPSSETSMEFDESGVFVVPSGVTSIDVCMIGGGSKGNMNGRDCWGGFAGELISTTLAVRSCQKFNVVIGPPSGDTKFGSLVAVGSSDQTHGGSGDTRDTCFGQFQDGGKTYVPEDDRAYYGGEAGLSDGAGNRNTVSPLRGAGGGGGSELDGGPGFVSITWGA